MEQTQLVKINFLSGIISPGILMQVLDLAASLKIAKVHFGARQQLLIDVPKDKCDLFALQCAGKGIAVSTSKHIAENIVSSYAAAGIFIFDGWLSQGVYKDVFDLFNYSPKLKININDGGQTFVPLFTGNINWVASPNVHYWYLYIRFPKTNTLYRWPQLIYTNSVAAVSKSIEKFILNEKIADGSRLFDAVKKASAYISKSIEKELHLPKFHLPYYEGFNAMDGHFWLGIYRRDEMYSVAFLKDLCAICLQTKINELYITSWKTLIVKSIDKIHRRLWDVVLGRHRINVRHAANELAWLVEDDCEDGLILKRHVIRYFDKEDVRTYGLCFSVKMANHSGMFGSVVIRKEVVKNPDRLKSLERFTILYTADFNPNGGELIVFRQRVEKEFLGPYLVALCKQFYEAGNTDEILVHEKQVQTSADTFLQNNKPLYRCRYCLTVYDESLGDESQCIAPGTAFNELPTGYCCPLCEAQAIDFRPVCNQRTNILSTNYQEL